MITSDVNQMLLECERFVKMLKHEKQALSRLRKYPTKEDIDYTIRSNPELVKMASWRLAACLASRYFQQQLGLAGRI